MTSKTSLSVLALVVLLLILASSFLDARDDGGSAHDGPSMNFHRVSSKLATGGHFTDDGIATLAAQGVTLVVDLRDRPPRGQEKRLADAGIRWLNVPVVWSEPRTDDFEDFRRLMSENKDENIFVQCQGNYRASAMTYLYRVVEEGVNEIEARKDLNAIWTPEGTWAEYIDEIRDEYARR